MAPYPDPPDCGAHVPPGPLSAVRNGRYYTATVELEGDGAEGVYRGWLQGVPTSVTFTADTEKELQAAFERALDDYLETARL